MRWEVGGRFKREGPCVCLWLIRVDVWQKPTQFCEAIILQLRISKEQWHSQQAGESRFTPEVQLPPSLQPSSPLAFLALLPSIPLPCRFRPGQGEQEVGRNDFPEGRGKGEAPGAREGEVPPPPSGVGCRQIPPGPCSRGRGCPSSPSRAGLRKSVALTLMLNYSCQ